MKRLLSLVAALGAMPVLSMAPQPLEGDPRIETLAWRDGAELPLRTTAGGALTIVFAPGERVQTVVVGDPGSVEVQVAPQADSMMVRAQRQPTNSSIDVRTHLRSYRFRLVVGPANDVAYVVRFSIGQALSEQPAIVLPSPEVTTGYALKGRESLRPKRVSDDGTRTFLEWQADQSLPAVFAVNALGEEETVDGYMRGEVMVIDRVYSQLIFRFGKQTAQARRLEPGKARK